MKSKLLPILLAVLLAATCMAAEPAPPYPGPDTPVRTGQVNVLDFGAKDDGKTDNADAFQEILNSFDKPKGRWGWSEAGGTMLIPDGHWVVKRTLDVPCGQITVQGSGGCSNFNRVCWIDFRGNGPLFRFAHDARSPEGFVCRDITLVRETPAGTSAFEVWTGPNKHSSFRLDMTWDNVGVFHFKTAFCIRRESGAGYQIGGIVIEGCNWSLGEQAIVFEGATSVNRMTIRDSIMRQHRPKTPLPALDIRGQGVTLVGNIFEGQADALLLRDGEKYEVAGNHFEQNSSTAIVAVGCDGLTVRDNVFSNPKDFRGKIRLTEVNRLRIDAPAETWVLDRCRNVTSELGTWRGTISTERSK